MALSATSTGTNRKSPEISQGGGETGRSASENFGFTRRTKPFDATQSSADRWAAMSTLKSWDLSEQVIAACIEVHRQLGPGLLESIYEAALVAELTLRGFPFERQLTLPVRYKGLDLDQLYRVDLIVAERLLVEVKSVEALLPVHAAQVLTYLRITGLETGLLVNFNTELIRNGLRRLSRTPNSRSRNSPSPRLPVKSRPA